MYVVTGYCVTGILIVQMGQMKHLGVGATHTYQLDDPMAPMLRVSMITGTPYLVITRGNAMR